MSRSTIFTALIVAGTILQACMTAPVPETSSSATAVASQPASRTFLYAWGMYADPVFDRDVETFTRTFTRALGTPTQTNAFGFTSPRLSTPDIAVMERELVDVATQAKDGLDTVVVMLTSHGAPDVLAVKPTPDGPIGGVSADELAEFLSPLADDRQILILQACFSGSLIDELRSPNRIILTAAAADRSSFGCNPDSENTWFIKSLNQALTEVAASGGSWEQVFARTRQLVAADETTADVRPSNPQFFVGANMQSVWSDNSL